MPKEPVEIVKEVSEALNKRLDTIDAAIKAHEKGIEDRHKTMSAQLQKLGGDKVEGDATLAEQFAAEKKLLREMRETVERYTKQLPLLAGRKAAERDPDYDGLWPNAERAAQFGYFMIATLHSNGEVRKAGAEEVVKAGLTLRNDSGQLVKGESFIKAMSESVDAAGGYLVPDEFVATIIRHVKTYGVARGRLLNVPMSRETQTWPKRTGGLTVYYPDEGAAPTASDMSFGLVKLTAKKWSVLTHVTRELEEDAVIGIGEILAFEIALSIAQAEDLNAFRGDGTSLYVGITGVLNSPNVAVVTMGAGKDTFAEIDHDELVRLKYAVPGWVRNMPDCAYFMCSGIVGICERIKDGEGRLMYNPPTETHPLRIAGFPVVETEVMPDTNESAISTKFIAFGSLQAWGMLGQRRGMTIQRSYEVKFLEQQITIMATARQDIQEAVGEAMAVLKTAAA